MATQQATRIAPNDCSLPLYRMDVGTYMRLVDAGALEGVEVELLDGLLINKHSHREDAIHRLDVGTYEQMVASGVLGGQRIELLEGLLVEVSPQGPDHAEVIRRLTRYLAAARAWLGVQLPLEARWGALPEPDLVLTESPPPRGRHPRTALLAVEVAVSSHKEDRGEKAIMYAGAPVPTYWLVDVPGHTVEVRTDPGPRGYNHCEVYGVGASVPSPAEGVPDLEVATLFEGLAD
jgi:Uma2 family endonuclease